MRIVHGKKNLLKLIEFISYDLSGFALIFRHEFV